MNEWIELPKKLYMSNLQKRVAVVAEIRHNESGEIVEYDTQEILCENEQHPSTFDWRENNYSCDCNRHLFFNRAKGIENDDCWDKPCTDSKYSVNLKNKKDGEIYYKEF